MKKRNLRMIKCAWLIAMVLMAFNARAATTLYWRGTGSAGGVLSAGTNFNGSFWSTAMSGAGSVTNAIANNDLVINMNAAAGNYTNLTSTAVSIASLMLNNSGACGLTTTFTGNLTVSGAITINGNMTNPNNNGNTGWIQFVINSGVTVQCGSYTAVNGSVANGNNYILARINGTLVCTGNLSLSSSTTVATFIGGSSNADQMQIGDGNSTGVLSVGGTTTVTTNANTGGGLIVGISVNSPSTATFNGDMNLGSAGSAISRIYNEEGTTINFNGANVTIGGAGAMGGNSVGGNVVFDRNGAQTFTVNSTVNNCQMGALFIGSSNSPTVTVAGSGNIYLTNPYHYDASFNQVYDPAIVTIKAGATLDLGTQTMNFTSTGSTAMLTVNGTLKLAGANNFPGSFNTYSLAAGSTVEYYGSVAQTAAQVSYGNLTFTNGGTGALKTLAAGFNMSGNLLINSTAALNVASNQITGSGNTFTNNGYLYVGGATNFPGSFGTYSMATASTVDYNGGVAQTAAQVSYGNLVFTNGGTGALKTLAAGFNMSGNLLINSTAALNVASNQITGSGNTFTNNGYLYVGGATNFPGSFGTYSMATASTVEYNGGVAQTAAQVSYGNLVFTNGGTGALKTLAAGFNMSGNLLINSTAALNVASNQITGSGNTFTNNGYLYVGGATNFPGSFGTYTMASASTVEYNGGVAQTAAQVSYGNLTFTNGNTSAKKTLAAGFNMSGNLLVNSSAYLNVATNQITGAAGFTFTNNGYLYVGASNFPASFGTNTMATTSTVEYNGTAAQTVKGIAYGNLVANSTGPLNVSGTATVSTTATLTNGIINNALQFASSVSSGTTGSAASYVNGIVARFSGGGFTFPTGYYAASVGGDFHPIAATVATGSLNTSAKYYSTGAVTPNYGNFGLNVNAIDPAAYWGFNATAATGTVSLTTRDETGVFEVGAMVFVVGMNSANQWVKLGTATTPTGANQLLTSDPGTDMSLYSNYTVGSGNFLLPITLTSFTGTAGGCTAALAWATSLESNSSYYAVEASLDGSIFAQVGKVAGKNSPTGATYSYGYPLGIGTEYFRLKAVDFDGKFTYSSTVAVTGTGACGTGLSVKVFPNPTSNVLNIQGLATGSHVSLISMSGQKMTEVTTTGTSQGINISKYAKGIYVLRIENASGNVGNVKVVKD